MKTRQHQTHHWFRGLADPIRLRIMNCLAAGELCVCDIVDLLGLPQPTVSRHLAYLRRSGLVVVRRARFSYYSLAASPDPVHAALIDVFRSAITARAEYRAERRKADIRVGARTTEPCE
jgi:ArsR family transcriptional regulator